MQSGAVDMHIGPQAPSRLVPTDREVVVPHPQDGVARQNGVSIGPSGEDERGAISDVPSEQLRQMRGVIRDLVAPVLAAARAVVVADFLQGGDVAARFGEHARDALQVAFPVPAHAAVDVPADEAHG